MSEMLIMRRISILASCIVMLMTIQARADDIKIIASDIEGKIDSNVDLNISTLNAPDNAIVHFEMPYDAKLSMGVDIGGGHWFLAVKRIKEVRLTTPIMPMAVKVCLLSANLRRLTADVRFTVTRAQPDQQSVTQ